MWTPQPPTWTRDEIDLLPKYIEDPAPVRLENILEASESFQRHFPVDTGRCKTLQGIIDRDTLQRNINSARPVIHENVIHLYAKYILLKQRHGNAIEKAVYKDMDVAQFIDRLLTKRAVVFMGKKDTWMLLDGTKGNGNWESVGTLQEKPPLLLRNCLSYEEIKLAAFLSVSSYTYFVNVGDRKNFGVYQPKRELVQDEGVIMGIIGPRLVKPKYMDCQEMIVDETQNNQRNGYGNVSPPTIHHLFAQFYDEECLEYKDIKDKGGSKFTNLRNGELLDNVVYQKRLTITIDTLFLEANRRASEKNTKAFIHVVGIGLGVWKKHPCQDKLFMDCCGERIIALGSRLKNVSDICFSYIDHTMCLTYKHKDVIPIEGHPCEGIKVRINKREPNAQLNGKDQTKLLVVSYAWDGNALPGNEYWNKKLGSSGDSAAASSTQITELHNPFINPLVCSANLRVVTKDDVVEFVEFVEGIRRGQKRKEPEF